MLDDAARAGEPERLRRHVKRLECDDAALVGEAVEKAGPKRRA